MPADKLLKEGEALFQAGRQDEAAAAFRKILEISPGHSRAANNLVVMALAGGRPAEARTLLAGVLALDPLDQAALDNLLNLSLMERKWAAVRAVARDLLALRPDDPRLLKIAVRADLDQEAWPEARAKADRLLELAPADPEALELSALIHFKTGQPEPARRELAAVLAADPGRTDLAVRLALLANPGARTAAELWPDPTGHSAPALAHLYHRAWNGLAPAAPDGTVPRLEVADPVIRAARTLARLVDPGGLTDQDLPLNPPPPPDPAFAEKIPAVAADVAGLSIMFAPTVIAGQSAMMARWLRGRGARASVVEVSRNYLGYEADYYYPADPAETRGFLDLMMKKAEKVDVLSLEFGSSFHYMPNFIDVTDLRQTREPGQPYADLRRLKDKGVKLFFQFWGSDCISQSVVPYLYLRYLGFDQLPRPPFQNRFQYENIRAADELADAFLGPEMGLGVLPRTAPFRDVYIEPEHWPMKTDYRPRVEKILTAPTSPRKKNYGLIQSALGSLRARRPEAAPYRVQNTPHAQVPPLYAQADVGIDQATFGFGTFAVEMMALGLPVIASRPPTRGYRDLAPVLSFSNIRELAARLEECVQNPDQLPELGRRGREYVMEYHDIEVGGRAFSHYLAEAAAGGAVPQLRFPDYARQAGMWRRHPETVYAFRFFDAAVPLFCALGEPEYAAVLCREALACGYRPIKFTAWFQAVDRAWPMGLSLPGAAPEMPELARQTARRLEMLKSSKALLDDYAAELAEAEKIKGGEF